MCVRTNARARVARVTGPGCEGAKRTAQRPGTAARAAGSAGGERRREKTRAVHPHTTAGVPLSRGEPPSAQRPAHGAPGLAPLGHPATASLYTAAPTRLTPPTHPHTTSASGKHTHTRSARRALQPDGSALSRGQRGSPADTVHAAQRSLCSAPRSTAIPRDREGRGLSVLSLPSAAPGDTLHVLRAHNTSLQCREGRSAALRCVASQTIGPDAAWAVASVPSMAVALPVASHPCIVVQADSVFLWRERFVRCDCAGRALLADVRGGVVCK